MRRLIPTLLLICATVFAQRAPSPTREFIRTDAPVIALTHVRIVDGTGAPAKDDQTLVIDNGRIATLGPAASTNVPTGAMTLDLRGYTLLPGMVGMHDHMFFPMGGNPPQYSNMPISFTRLYLAAGVTTIRTTGSVQPYEDLELKKLIDAGKMAGPKMHVTAPYLEGTGSFTPVMHTLADADDARQLVAYWADQGATSFKAYMNITRAELAAVVDEAHKRGLKVTGHLCSIGFKEAAELGIDDLEHGWVVDTEFASDKKPDQCNEATARTARVSQDVESAPVQDTIKFLVQKNVALTSTLPVFEAGVPNAPAGQPQRPLLQERVLNVMDSEARSRYLGSRARIPADSPSLSLLKKEMQFERDFAKAGGLLLAGLDPTGNGGVVAGFGDQRELELLVEAGFTPLEAIRIATLNGATFLGEQSHIGSLGPGKQADIIVVHGSPDQNINDIEKTEIVFKDGVGYDSEKLIRSVQGTVGTR
jgi:imidazolonepropionase-like amidohydrolase